MTEKSWSEKASGFRICLLDDAGNLVSEKQVDRTFFDIRHKGEEGSEIFNTEEITFDQFSKPMGFVSAVRVMHETRAMFEAPLVMRVAFGIGIFPGFPGFPCFQKGELTAEILNPSSEKGGEK